jgi:hypothetical protein
MIEGNESEVRPQRRRHKGRRTARSAPNGITEFVRHPKSGRLVSAAMVAVTIAFMGVQWHLFSQQVQGYGPLGPGMSSEEVRYFAGTPDSVVQNTAGSDHEIWYYNNPTPMEVNLAGGRVENVACSDLPERVSNCPSALGLRIGDWETDLYARLGDPTTTSLSSGRKLLRYQDLGYAFSLERARVYRISLQAPDGSGSGKLARFLLWTLP